MSYNAQIDPAEFAMKYISRLDANTSIESLLDSYGKAYEAAEKFNNDNRANRYYE